VFARIMYGQNIGVIQRRNCLRLRLNRRSLSGSRENAAGNTLIATSRPSRASRAR